MYLAFDTGLHYLTFMGTNLENKKTLMHVQTMNSVSMNNKNIVNILGMFNDNAIMNLFVVDNTRMKNVSCE